MKGDSEEYVARRFLRQQRREEPLPRKINTLFSDLMEKEEEIAVYKERLKELEKAFYHNLQIISERDLELNILEEQLKNETEKLQQTIQEKDELEDIVKTVDDKSCRQIQHLQTKLSVKDEEIRKLHRENLNNVAKLEKMLADVRHQQEKQICKLTTKFEFQKNEMMKGYRKDMEEKEKYYLLEIDNLSAKFEEICSENEKYMETKEENRNLKFHMADMERHFREKERYYIQEMNKMNKEIRSKAGVQVDDRETQAVPDTTTADSQTTQNHSDLEEHYKKRLNFLQEQNEVLKFVIKDLKKNRDIERKTEDDELDEGGGKCSECAAVKAEIEDINKKFGKEIDDLKKIMHEEQKQRAEEEVVMQSLETSVTCLKDKLLSGLHEKLEEFAGDDICSYTYNREIQNEIKVSLLEQKLDKTMDFLVSSAEEERQKLNEKLEELKRECVEKMEKYLKPREEPTEIKSENLLEKIRHEIQKLENKIESDMKNMVRNNSENNKCDKNFQTRLADFPDKQVFEPDCFRIISRTGPGGDYAHREQLPKGRYPPRIYCRNDIGHEVTDLEVRGEPMELRRRDQRSFRRVTNDLGVGR